MSSDNPYTSPTTQLRDTAPPPQDLATLLFRFDGRVPRRVYWGVSILGLVVFYAAVFVGALILGQGSLLVRLWVLALYIPLLWILLAVGIKRWHDRDKSGWWVLINLIPIIGGIWSFVEQGCLRGTVGPNNYGQDPT